ncbi:MAG: hypothetical protein ACRDUV_18150 [Pseudonocardiaceae bacterium]
MTGKGPTASEASYAWLCERLRAVLVDAVQAGRGAAGGIGSVPCQASAALYALLMAHPVDRRGRCRSCRHPGAVLGCRRRRCRVHGEARFWLLQQPAEFLHSRLVCELGLTDLPPAQDSTSPTAARDLGDTDVVSGIEPDPSNPCTTPVQTPAIPPPLPPRRYPGAGWPDPDHGGVEEHSDSPRPRRDPPPADAQPPPEDDRSLVLTQGVDATR